ncbi:glutamine--tRNA ligase/YqeY domain fusion protein [Hujiaoplasma nucleasis]|uniref:Glutamine--tRNA ligase n=1 Tax=Hujiaoplasma nucleasis TaxID=2725268 RepID=A0A7L6N7I3_9MOLU|nr:glutamine--tRNA ligase/YqeY domain fusion protein [Hujiaoplasma nucleasis]QLY40499.1 glutamine--tRNA ligase/YqeY domain fusion protein [Hujiaoplasma nucleasis]
MESNFVKTIMEEDLKSGKVNEIITRFPPEPSAYLHIGHARAIITNFELAKHFKGRTNLRFDDTNPSNEDQSFVDAIIKDIEWLGYHPDKILYGSDYFDTNYQLAIKLIKKGLAYVCDLNPEQMREYRGTLTEAGRNSPYRERSIEENLKLFEEMKDGKYQDGEKTLRAKIDMASPNMNMRDPVVYRIMHHHHQNTGDKWCIYPMYDFAHPIQDAIEGVTHSLCSLEYDDHRVLYDWFVEKCEMEHIPHQYEFGRLNITNTIMSKRYLKALVESGKVHGFDDPRMPTLAGLKRRGFTKEAIRDFILSTGLSRVNSTVSSEMLENAVRNDLNYKVKRVHAILNPLKVTITNYPDDQVEWIDDVDYNPDNENLGSRKIAFSKHLYIDREDFVEEKPNKKWKRLAKDVEVRLMRAYFIKCHDVVKDDSGEIIEILCTYDQETKSGSGFNDRKPNGNIHYVEATTAKKAEFNLFEPLLLDSDSKKDLFERLNPNSWATLHGFVESALEDTQSEEKFQFIRVGYFTTDYDSSKERLIFNRTVELKSTFK